MDIENLLQGKPASDMFNFRSPSFKKLDLDHDKLADADLVDLMLREPRLIRRPVVSFDDKIYFGADARVLAGLIS